MTVDIRKPLKQVLPHLLQARQENLNEADTVQRLIKVFEDVLGYDLMTDISREAQLKRKYIDIVLKIDGVVRILVEAKPAQETLRDRHIEQAHNYASRNNYPWVLLSNGVLWNLYHLTFGEGIEYEQVFSVDLSREGGLDDAAQKLAVLHKTSVRKGDLDDYWRRTHALSAASIAKGLFHSQVLMLIRREIRRAEGLLIDVEDLARAIQALFSSEAREEIGPVRVRAPRRRRRAAPTNGAAAQPVAADASPAVAPPPPATAGGAAGCA